MKRTIFTAVLAALFFLPVAAKKTFEHPWQGKRVAYFGDSVTDPNLIPKTKYWSFLQQWLDITPYVYAVSGRRWDDIPRQAKALKDEHGDNFDAIMILMGTNDYNGGMPIGSWYDETSQRVEAATGKLKTLQTRMMRQPSMDKGTYRGCINIAMSLLKSMFPTKQIILLTPLHRGYAYFGDKNVQPDERYQNKGGEYLDPYVQSVREAGEVWAVPVIDIANLSGLYPLEDGFTQYFNNAETDRLHPSQKGHERIARTLMYQLLALPCTFDEK